MTAYGTCKRPHLVDPAVEALRESPSCALENRCAYLSQQEYDRHDGVCEMLLSLTADDQLPFPYQIGKVLETLKLLTLSRKHLPQGFVRSAFPAASLVRPVEVRRGTSHVPVP